MLLPYHLVLLVGTVNVGDNVSVTVSFGQKISAADISVSFDTSKFVFTGSVSAGRANLSGSRVAISYFEATSGVSSITLTFKAKAVRNSETFQQNVHSQLILTQILFQ